MDRCRWFVATIVAGLAAAPSPEASGQTASRSTIAVIVYDYARVTPGDMASARGRVTVIFAKAGVDLVWSGPSSTTGEPAAGPSGCQQLFAVQVMIRPRRPGWAPKRKRIMGEALAAGDARAVLSLFYDAILGIALRYNASLDEILAVALAHELGHALLPPPAHVTTGVMQARWEGDDIRHAVGGSLAFSERQAEMIRAKAERRCAFGGNP